MRVVNTRVLPLPAPASIKADREGSSTAARCSGFSPDIREGFMGKLSHTMVDKRAENNGIKRRLSSLSPSKADTGPVGNECQG
jgi:hypothetical protein